MARQEGEKVSVKFAVAGPTDVEVAVLDAKGRVVRHLAAGRLGQNAPAPLRPDSLAQQILWDGTDDLGTRAGGGPFTVRVRIGSRPRLGRQAGGDPYTIGGGIVGLAVGARGELFVMDSPGFGRTTIRVFHRDGKYLRTILPYPAATPRERTAAIGHVELEGERVPLVFNALGGNILPLTNGMRHQTMAFHPKGYLLLVSALGTYFTHGPPRHLLAVHPAGGAPDRVGCVGPEIRPAKGFLGGAGESGVRRFDHLAVSPDGEFIYFVPFAIGDRNPRHAVFRLRWTDAKLAAPFLGIDGDPGSDDAHLNDPQGVAVDANGRLYVCDRGNNRVRRFAADGKPLGAFPVPEPEQVAVHRKTGAIYVLSRGVVTGRRATWSAKATLRKFSPWTEAAPKELARLEERPFELIALDGEAEPARVWAVLAAGWNQEHLLPVVDRGGALEAGQPINRYQGLRFPMFLAPDPARNRVLVREMSLGNKGMMVLDLDSNQISRLRNPQGQGLVGADMALDRDGNIYVMDGYGKNSLSRYRPDGRTLPFSAAGSHTIETGVYRGYGPDMGLRGHCVSLAGDVYLIRSSNYGGPGEYGARVDVFGPDGKPKKRNLVDGLGYGDCGLGVDVAGNVYVGANVKPADEPVPREFMGKVSVEPFAWWRRGQRQPPWHYMYLNPYLFHWGSVVKFGLEGGALYGQKFGRETTEPIPEVFFAEKAPAGSWVLRSAYLTREIRVHGAKWRHPGMGIIPSSWDGPLPDPGCVCLTSRLAVDAYGRVFAPNVFRFCVEMLDTNGNLVARIGAYGNADSGVGGRGSAAGETRPASTTPTPDIAFAWPAFVAVADGKVYVSDTGNARVTVIGFGYAAEATCAVP